MGKNLEWPNFLLHCCHQKRNLYTHFVYHNSHSNRTLRGLLHKQFTPTVNDTNMISYVDSYVLGVCALSVQCQVGRPYHALQPFPA